MRQSQPSGWQQTLAVLVTVAGAAVIAWAGMPPDQRQWAALAARARLRRMLHRTARAAGQAGMGSELAGYEPTAHAGYGLAYRLSALRDRL
jgi:hypothetical protein